MQTVSPVLVEALVVQTAARIEKLGLPRAAAVRLAGELRALLHLEAADALYRKDVA